MGNISVKKDIFFDFIEFEVKNIQIYFIVQK